MFESLGAPATPLRVHAAGSSVPPPGQQTGAPEPCLPAADLLAMPRSLMLRSLSTCQPGPAVMCQLAGLDPAGLTGEERIDYVIAWERCEAWVAAGKQRALAVMGTAPGDPDPLDVHLGLAPIQGSSADLVSRADAQDERGVHSEAAFASAPLRRQRGSRPPGDWLGRRPRCPPRSRRWRRERLGSCTLLR